MLSLTANNLNGTLPTQIGQLESSVHFGVTSNRFTGSLPSEIGVLKRLIVFHIAENGFTGVFPESLGQLALMGNLKSVDVHKNQFDGTIPRPICDILVYSEGCEHPAANP